MATSLFGSLNRTSRSKPARSNSTRKRTHRRAFFEPLEGRALLATIYVDDNWAAVLPPNDPDGPGPAGAFGTDSFADIQSAINGATAGDTIEIYPGNYVGDVVIDKALTLRAVGNASDTTIQGVSLGTGGAVKIQASDVMLGTTNHGFTIVGTGESAVYLVSGSQDISIRSNTIQAASGKAGILTEGGVHNITINGNTFTGDAAQHIYVNGQASVGVASTNVDIVNNTFNGNATGPLLGLESTGGAVANNTFNGDSPYGIIELWGGMNAVTGNTVTGQSGNFVLDPGNQYNLPAIQAANNFVPVIDGTAGDDIVTITAVGNGNFQVDYSLNGGAVLGSYTTTLAPGTIAFNGLGGNDVLNLNVTAEAGAVLVATADGRAEFETHGDVLFNGVETFNLIDGGAVDIDAVVGDLYVRGTPGADVIQTMVGYTQTDSTRLRVRVNASIGYYHLPGGAEFIAYGRGGNDTMTHSAQIGNAVRLYGEDGNDYLVGGTNADLLVGGAGADNIVGGAGANVIYGDDAPAGPALPAPESATDGNDTLYGGANNDSIYGQGGSDRVYAGAGADYVVGGSGNDTLSGDAGDDRIFGGLGNDTLYGGTDDDLLSGEDGTDTLSAGSGNDVTFGGDGADTLMGADGNDLIVGGTVTNQQSSYVGDTNDLALAILLSDWSTSGDRTTLGGVGDDGDVDRIYSGAGNDDIANTTGLTADIIFDFSALNDEKFPL